MPKTFINKVPTRVWRVSQSLYQHEWTNTKCGMNCWAFKSANTLCQQSQQSSHFFPDMAMIGYDWLWIKTYSTGIGARWTLNYQLFWALPKKPFAFDPVCHMGMDQYLLIPFLVGWTSIYQLFWCSPGVQGFDTLPYFGKEDHCKCGLHLELEILELQLLRFPLFVAHGDGWWISQQESSVSHI